VTPRLRVIDAGRVSALRSQALWHGIADAMSPGDDPVLSFCRPSEPYVCVGYHRSLDELDLDACKRMGLPVMRRQIGGGPVYLDSDQLFFQLTLPTDAAPAGVHRLYEQLLEPAAKALRWLGVRAQVASTNDIVANGRKVSGTGAGQIGDGVVVVGNVMFAFPHERMAAVLRLPDEDMRCECLRLMRAHVGALPRLREGSIKSALRRAYATALRRLAVPDATRSREDGAIAHWERQLSDLAWIVGPSLPPMAGRQVKVCAGVWVYDRADEELRVRTTVERGRVISAHIDAPSLNGQATALARALVGVAAEHGALRARLEEFGDDGLQVLHALEPGLMVR
jgi:lipoate---protein ligase